MSQRQVGRLSLYYFASSFLQIFPMTLSFFMLVKSRHAKRITPSPLLKRAVMNQHKLSYFRGSREFLCCSFHHAMKTGRCSAMIVDHHHHHRPGTPVEIGSFSVQEEHDRVIRVCATNQGEPQPTRHWKNCCVVPKRCTDRTTRLCGPDQTQRLVCLERHHTLPASYYS